MSQLNQKYPRPFEPLVAKNPFRQQQGMMRQLPSFEEAREKLPRPVITGYESWEKLYWQAWELIWGAIQTPPADSPLRAPYLTPHHLPRLFMWDCAFIAQYGLYGRRAFSFIDILNHFYARQHDDGFICREIDIETGEELFLPFDPDGTGPNIFAWSEWRYYRATGNESRLRQVFYPLIAFYRWCRQNRSWPSGLYWATGTSCGMDNQERVADGLHHHQRWSWIGATMQAAVSAMLLQRMALVLDESGLVDELAADRSRMKQAINEICWDEDTAFYHDVSPDGRKSRVKSIGAFWGLYDKDLIPQRRQDALFRHLRDKGSFATPHRVPTISADSPGFDPLGGYWRGSVWSPTNYMVLRGLRTVGQHHLAHEIAINHLMSLQQVHEKTGFFWENYAANEPGAGEPAAANAIGWAGLSPIGILIEDVIGLWADWPQRTVYWDRRLNVDGHFGVQNYPLGPNETADILGDGEMVLINSTTPFTLVLRTSELSLQTAVPAGSSEIPFN